MPAQNGNHKDLIDRHVVAAFAAEGFNHDDGSIDMAKTREHMFEVLRPRKVLNLRERGEKAVTRGQMVEELFPHLTTPDSVTNEQEAMLAQEIWKEIDRRLWAEAKPSAGSSLQRLVGLNMGNGYVLCRTTVGKDRTSAAYITDDVACIERDYILPDRQSLERKARQSVANHEMLIMRKPEHGSRWMRSFTGQINAIKAIGQEQLTLALEAATTPPAEDEEETES